MIWSTSRKDFMENLSTVQSENYINAKCPGTGNVKNLPSCLPGSNDLKVSNRRRSLKPAHLTADTCTKACMSQDSISQGQKVLTRTASDGVLPNLPWVQYGSATHNPSLQSSWKQESERSDAGNVSDLRPSDRRKRRSNQKGDIAKRQLSSRNETSSPVSKPKRFKLDDFEDTVLDASSLDELSGWAHDSYHGDVTRLQPGEHGHSGYHGDVDGTRNATFESKNCIQTISEQNFNFVPNSYHCHPFGIQTDLKNSCHSCKYDSATACHNPVSTELLRTCCPILKKDPVRSDDRALNTDLVTAGSHGFHTDLRKLGTSSYKDNQVTPNYSTKTDLILSEGRSSKTSSLMSSQCVAGKVSSRTSDGGTAEDSDLKPSSRRSAACSTNVVQSLQSALGVSPKDCDSHLGMQSDLKPSSRRSAACSTSVAPSPQSELVQSVQRIAGQISDSDTTAKLSCHPSSRNNPSDSNSVKQRCSVEMDSEQLDYKVGHTNINCQKPSSLISDLVPSTRKSYLKVENNVSSCSEGYEKSGEMINQSCDLVPTSRPRRNNNDLVRSAQETYDKQEAEQVEMRTTAEETVPRDTIEQQGIKSTAEQSHGGGTNAVEHTRTKTTVKQTKTKPRNTIQKENINTSTAESTEPGDHSLNTQINPKSETKQPTPGGGEGQVTLPDLEVLVPLSSSHSVDLPQHLRQTEVRSSQSYLRRHSAGAIWSSIMLSFEK